MSLISFPCPVCGGKLETKDSRPTTFRGKPSVRRRRACKECRKRVTTFEIINDGNDFAAVKLPKMMGAARVAKAALDEMLSRYDEPTA